MPVPFKKDPTRYNQRTLFATNVFDLLADAFLDRLVHSSHRIEFKSEVSMREIYKND